MHTIAIPIANSVSGDIFFFMSGSLLSLSDNSLLQTGAKVNRQIAQNREKRFLNFCSKKLLTNQGWVWYNFAGAGARHDAPLYHIPGRLSIGKMHKNSGVHIHAPRMDIYTAACNSLKVLSILRWPAVSRLFPCSSFHLGKPLYLYSVSTRWAFLVNFLCRE